jgi:hypothetical protein
MWVGRPRLHSSFCSWGVTFLQIKVKNLLGYLMTSVIGKVLSKVEYLLYFRNKYDK